MPVSGRWTLGGSPSHTLTSLTSLQPSPSQLTQPPVLVAARDLRDQYRRLCQVDEIVGLTGLEIEYNKVESTVHQRGTQTFGTLEVNKPKNRYTNIDMIPCELPAALCSLSVAGF